MQIRIEETFTWRVQEAANAKSGWVFDPGKGVWWLELPDIENFINERMAPESFGDSVERFVLGFELIDFSEGRRGTEGYMSFRPKAKTLVSVAQLDWPSLKHLSATAQFALFRQALLESVSRIGEMKRKPRFDYERFRAVLEETLGTCDGSEFSAPLEFSLPPSAVTID